jgi:fructokinase
MILVAGEALIDMTPARCGESIGYLPHPGGSPYNVAVGIGRLEVPVAFLGRLSTDAFGRLLRGHLEASRVSLRYLVDAEEATTLAFVHTGEGEPEYSFYSERTADRMLLPEHLPAIPVGAALHFRSISLVLEPGASTLEGLMRRESRRRLLSLDPNVRPSLITEAASRHWTRNSWKSSWPMPMASQRKRARGLGQTRPARKRLSS